MHSFSASGLDKTICAICKRGLRDHTAIAQCEVCPKIGPCELYGDILFCKSCYDKEMTALAASKAEAEQRVADSRKAFDEKQKAEAPMTLDSLVSQSQKIDQSIEMSSDIWNAKTVDLDALIKAINADESIENKPYARAKLAMERIETFSKAIFDHEQALVDARIGLRHSKTYLNQIISDLREAEREEFRLKDITYPVKPVKTPKPKGPGTKKAKASTKVDLVECARFGKYLGVKQDAIHALAIQYGVGAKGAARILSGLMNLPWNDEWN